MSDTIRVRLQATRYPHWGAHTGIGQFVRHLASDRFHVTCKFAEDDDTGLPLPGALARAWLRRRVQQRGMAWYKLSDLAAEMQAFAAAALGRVDIIHFLDGEHGVQFIPSWCARLPRRNVKIVASFHQPASLLPSLVDPRVLPELHRVVLISPNQYEFFAAHLPPERIVTILHGIDTEYFIPGPPKMNGGKFRCLTVGYWLRDWTAIAGAVKQLQEQSDIEFHLVAVSDTGLEALPSVITHKGLSDAELRRLSQECDALLLPFRDATASNSLLEGMACGLPVISTDLLSVRAYVGDHAGLLVAPGKSDGLVGAILTLKNDLSRRTAMGRAARTRALELAWPRIARDYAALYEDLARS